MCDPQARSYGSRGRATALGYPTISQLRGRGAPRRVGLGMVEDSVMIGQDDSSTVRLRRQEPRQKEWASSYEVEWARERLVMMPSLTESPDGSLNPSAEHN